MKSRVTDFGPGYVNPFGYVRVRLRGSRKYKMEHVLVWEAQNGPVPKGMEIHHINGIKSDNRIENLKVVSRLEHKRIHGGCELRDGNWWKPCRRCHVMQPIDKYYRKPDGIMEKCRRCCIELATHYKRCRRQRREMESELTVGV